MALSHLWETPTPDPIPRVQRIQWTYIKWMQEFCCIGTKKDTFSVPRPDELQARINANMGYFLMNYLCIVGGLSILAVVFHPLLLVMVVTFVAAWSWLLSRPPVFS